MLRILILLNCLSLGWISASSYALPIAGSCMKHDFSNVMDERGAIDTNQFVRVLRHDAPVYGKVDSQQPMTNLRFGDALFPLQINPLRKRIQVKKVGSAEPLGWLEGYDLLCGINPLQSDKGLDRKVFIKTPETEDPNAATVPAYPSYDESCHGRCQQLSRFRLYFIYADDTENQRYLIIDSHTLKGPTPHPLVGWVEYGRSIPWNTTLGMRPKENVKRISLQPQDSASGIELGGGNVWYTLPKHIPILDMDKDKGLYHVAAPSIGMQAFKAYKENVLAPMKLVDIFFLIDGTASMGPYIKAVKRAVKDIASKLRNELEFKETSFRFGFRMYRDTYADSISSLRCLNGVCEGMSLPTNTCQADSQATDANWRDFDKQLNRVKETTDDKGKDDYPEKLFNGLRQAIDDMDTCSKRTKILFVIGDHGDKQDELHQDLIDDLNSFNKKVIFLIQTPNNSRRARTPSAYQNAYQSYKEQAFQLLDQTLPTQYKGIKIARTDYFLSLNQTQLARQVVEQVKQYSPSAVVNELEQALAGGDSLQNILKQSMDAKGMPVLYWKWIEDMACSELGQQCQTIVDHRVVDFHISADKEKIQEEIWMTSDDLDNWLTLLKRFENLIGTHTVRKQREKFIRLLRQQIQEIIGGYPREDLILSEQLAMARKKILPMREDSPFLQYSIKDIREIEGCELMQLVEWVTSIRKVLQRVFNDSTQKVTFTLEYPQTNLSCPLSDKGKKLPQLKFGPVKALGPNDEYSYAHRLYDQTVYWLPVDFLP